MGGGVLGQGWAKAGTVKSRNMVKVFNIVYLLRFPFMRLRSSTRWSERTGVVQREWRRLTYFRYAIGKDCARKCKVNIIILRKQAKMTHSLYSCGYDGFGHPV
jgi:hypothetical protein